MIGSTVGGIGYKWKITCITAKCQWTVIAWLSITYGNGPPFPFWVWTNLIHKALKQGIFIIMSLSHKFGLYTFRVKMCQTPSGLHEPFASNQGIVQCLCMPFWNYFLNPWLLSLEGCVPSDGLRNTVWEYFCLCVILHFQWMWSLWGLVFFWTHGKPGRKNHRGNQ
jgi:hypothetical protein